ncbi:hypothetical protein KBY66_08005 [Synechococcus sp. Tobar12-5m-g]|uniref:hypothetical protein n=1 Tax=Synechococcus sp. Cruz CV-v-12 TaxID=2823728 RepID=UPI0037DA0E20|nr:hypothetical protein [Synechococcus sp. Tobar12-5m-g]MCP9873409.1 hypothetical protein [Synechococcus sp. Cruz CV-v-12]
MEELLGQLRQLAGRGSTEIVRKAIEQQLRRQRRLWRLQRLQHQTHCSATAGLRPGAGDSRRSPSTTPLACRQDS